MDGERSVPPQGGDGIDYSSHFVTEQIFDSYADASSWCKQVALGLRFELIISSKKPLRDGRVFVYLKCGRGGKYRGKGRDLSSAPRRKTKTKVCGCPFMIRVAEVEGSKFQVFSSSKYGFHNHKLFGFGEGHSVLTPPMKQMIREMSRTKSKPGKILLSLKETFAGSTPNIRQIYNELMKIKREAAYDGISSEGSC